MNPQIIDNGDGTFSQITTTTAPFDPVAIQAQITQLQSDMQGKIQSATDNFTSEYQPQIDALQATLDAATAQVPSIKNMLTPPQQVNP